jgi:hypothetical protein
MKKDHHYHIEHRIVWPNGSVRWVAETGDVVRGQTTTARCA